MTNKESVFEKAYENYLVQIDGIDFNSVRDLKDSSPLTNYFDNDVERAIVAHFNGRLGDIKKAGRSWKREGMK